MNFELLKKVYSGRTVFLTGCSGFKGAWLSVWLTTLGARVVGYALKPPTEPSMFHALKLDRHIISIEGDVCNGAALTEVCKTYKPEVIFHLAAQPLVRYSYLEPKETFETNVMGTVNVLEAARQIETVKSIVVVTSDKCYENREWVYGYRETDPLGGYDPYSASKGCTELVVSAFRNSFFTDSGIGLASARAGNVIGGGDWATDRLLPDFVRAVVSNKPIHIRNPHAIRPWQHVLEPLSGYLMLGSLLLAEPEKYGSAWNFGPRDTDVLSVEEILRLAIDEWGAGSVETEALKQPHEATLLKLDISKAEAYLRWHPVFSCREAIKRTVAWYKRYYEDSPGDMFSFTVEQIKEYEQLLQLRS
ncbi:CDP-glucose 4,6-dehydratase [Desulforamulus aeronauticus]|uniref:CDP-glucose 4,6-dehydratase n=1 Tax=Desulforamulus aeronauticus DSM 10349 TaxID=1121421 RepID=A0A1M6RDY8_9FIRM|nr:CDP-glucose 4,6-dehydratase [Desulforamulus aeronauticus]SHK30626.1 CDP-glucose 4,6-dehydratase [Desulforamulus aeronauticus DSM 10349]